MRREISSYNILLKMNLARSFSLALVDFKKYLFENTIENDENSGEDLDQGEILDVVKDVIRNEIRDIK